MVRGEGIAPIKTDHIKHSNIVMMGSLIQADTIKDVMNVVSGLWLVLSQTCQGCADMNRTRRSSAISSRSAVASPQQALHQHDLTASAAAQVVADAGIRPDDVVLEVGSGTGALTAALLQAGARVVAQEIDLQRAEQWRERFARDIDKGTASLVVGDARHTQPVLPDRWRLVANPPFNLSSALLRRWLIDGLPGCTVPTAVDLVLQAQVVEKLARPAPQATALGTICQCWGKVSRGNQLSRDSVTPPSHVPLAILHLRRGAYAPERDEMQRLCQLIDQGFSGEQQLRRALKEFVTPAIVKRQAKINNWTADAPARALSVDAWRSLAKFLHHIGKIN